MILFFPTFNLAIIVLTIEVFKKIYLFFHFKTPKLLVVYSKMKDSKSTTIEEALKKGSTNVNLRGWVY